jgi:putative endonuclease
MSNVNNSTVYVGVTNNLIRRVAEHKASVDPDSFTTRYNVFKLVYFEAAGSISGAIAREKQLKNWKRSWKDSLISSFNPTWTDLSKTIEVTDDVVKGVKESYIDQQRWAEICRRESNNNN